MLVAGGLLGLAVACLVAGSPTSATAAGVQGPASAPGGVITVCLSAQCDYTTIQAAVDAASDGDTIKVAQGIYTSSAFQVVYINKAITLTGGYTTTDWVNSHPVTQATVIDAEGVTRRRGVHIDGSGAATITLVGLTIQRGSGRDSEGGGVHIAAGKVVLRESQVLSNTASAWQWGAGIYAAGGTITLVDSTVRGNSPCGLYVSQSVLTVTLTGNTFQDNAGRGVYITGPSSAYPGPEDGDPQSSLVTLSGNTFQGNTGGGVLLRDVGTAIVEGNTFQNNLSGDDQDGGGGVAVRYSAVAILTDNSFQDNSALDGGGVRIRGGAATLVGNTFRDNSAERYGFGWVCAGGGLEASESVVTLTGNSFEGNSAEAYGGGLSASRSVITLTSNWFQGNRAIGSSSWPEPLGGGISVRGGTTTLSGNTILSNTAAYAGGGISIREDIVDASNDVIANNTSPFEGVYLSDGTLTARHWTLANNGSYALTTDGGSATLTNTIVSTHTAGGFWGSDITADHTLFFNSGTPCGGGASCTNSISGDPAFLDPDAGDYHIGPGSAALDAGVATDVVLDMDHEPRAYQAPDLGADEYWPPGALERLYLPLIMRHHS